MNPEIEVLPAQLEFLNSTATHTAYIGGFRSGKTWVGTLKALKVLMGNPGIKVAYYLPTYGLIEEVAIDSFNKHLESLNIPYTLNKSSYKYYIPHGEIIMRSMDNPDRIIGYEVGYSCIDEADLIPFEKMKYIFAKIIARSSAKIKGVVMTDVVSTPEGFGFAYDYFVKNSRANRRLIKVKTEDNPHLDIDYINTLKETYTQEQLAAYLNGEFINMTSGRVYKSFSRKANHTDRVVMPHEVLHIGMDFNITNMSAVVHVIDNGKFYAVAEITKVYDTEAMIRVIKDRYPGHSIVVYPDASGSNRSTSGLSDIRLLMQERWTIRAPGKNPFIRDRVNAMNLVFLTNKGEVRYFVNTYNCPEYTAALEQIPYKNGEPDKQSGLDHITDAGGYFIYMVSRPSFTI